MPGRRARFRVASVRGGEEQLWAGRRKDPAQMETRLVRAGGHGIDRGTRGRRSEGRRHLYEVSGCQNGAGGLSKLKVEPIRRGRSIRENAGGPGDQGQSV